MTLKYEIETTSNYDAQRDEYDYDVIRFDYEPETEDLYNALTQIIYEDYFKNNLFTGEQIKLLKTSIRNFINDIDINCETFEDDLRDYFEDKAKEEYFGE